MPTDAGHTEFDKYNSALARLPLSYQTLLVCKQGGPDPVLSVSSLNELDPRSHNLFGTLGNGDTCTFISKRR